MKKKLAMIVLTALIFTAMPLTANAAVSPAIEVISSKSEAVKAGLYNCDVIFTKADFLQNLGLSKIGSITFTSVPPSEEGYLYIGNTVINDGTKASEEMLNMLRFRAASAEVDGASFSYTLNEKYGNAEHCFNIVFLDGINSAPVAAIPESAPSFETYKNVPLYSRLTAVDPEGDAIYFKITEQPKSGTVEILSDSYGDFKYTPNRKHVGKDSFSYVVCDKYGNYSSVEKVTVKTLRNKTKTVFSDVKDTEYEYPAISVSANGLMQGTKIGKNTYFDPNGSVTRAEMLSYIMEAAGIELTEADTAKFSDADSVPEKYKAYVATAAKLGIIQGSCEAASVLFRPNDTVTRAEAAIMAKVVIRAEDKEQAVQTFADEESCPAWCEGAMKTAAAYGLLPISNGNMLPNNLLTRAEAAVMLNAIIKMK